MELSREVFLEFGYPRWMVPVIGVMQGAVAVANFHDNGVRLLGGAAGALCCALYLLRLFQPLTLTFPGAWAGVWQFLGQKLLAVLMGGCIFSHVCQVAPRERIRH